MARPLLARQTGIVTSPGRRPYTFPRRPLFHHTFLTDVGYGDEYDQKALCSGGVVAIDLLLSEAVVVSGTPTLKLNDGGTAFYLSGGSSNPAGGILEFDYVVASGQNTPDLTVNSLMLTGGASIADSAGNPVNATLPVAGKNLHLTVDSIRPRRTARGMLRSSIRRSRTGAVSRSGQRRLSRAAASTCRTSSSARRRRSPIPRMPPALGAP